MLSVVYGLAAALAYGAADFFGGVASRRADPVTVVLLSQAGTTPVLCVLIPVLGGELTSAALAWGAAAGLAGGVGVIALYRGLSRGAMSVVAPITAMEAAGLPVIFGLVRGERPGAIVLAGVVVALGAVALISYAPPAEEEKKADARGAIRDAFVAGAAFAAFFVALDASPPGSGAWPLLGVRLGSLVVIGIVIATLRKPVRTARSNWLLIGLAGALDVVANTCFILATRAGLLAVAAVLTSLYPGGTMLLARITLGERLSRVQASGVAVGAIGVVMIALG